VRSAHEEAATGICRHAARSRAAVAPLNRGGEISGRTGGIRIGECGYGRGESGAGIGREGKAGRSERCVRNVGRRLDRRTGAAAVGDRDRDGEDAAFRIAVGSAHDELARGHQVGNHGSRGRVVIAPGNGCREIRRGAERIGIREGGDVAGEARPFLGCHNSAGGGERCVGDDGRAGDTRRRAPNVPDLHDDRISASRQVAMRADYIKLPDDG